MTEHPAMTEDQLHRAVVEMLPYAFPKLLFWHTPNGGSRHKTEAARFRGLGVRAGVPDLVFILGDGRVAFIEIKRPRGYLTPPQLAFIAELRRRDVPVAVCRTVDEVRTTLDAWQLSSANCHLSSGPEGAA